MPLGRRGRLRTVNGFFASLQRFGLGRLAAFAGIGIGIAAAPSMES